MSKAEVAEIIATQNIVRPVIIDFENGNIHSDKNLQSALFKSKLNQTTVAVTTENMVYSGQVKDDSPYNNFVLIHNKKTNKIRLVQVDHAFLSPCLKEITEANNLVSAVAAADTSLSELNKQFGSKRTKRQVEQKERLQLNIDSVKEQLEQTVADITINEEDITVSKPSELDTIYKPPINRDARKVEDVYKLYDLVPKELFDALTDEAATVVDGNLSEFNLLESVKGYISDLNSITNSQEDKINRCKILIYVNYLVNFIMTPMKSVTKNFVVCEKLEVSRHILDNFTLSTATGRQRPISMKHRALCYTLVLLAFALNFKFNIVSLSIDIKIGLKKIIEVARILAFNTLVDNTVTLKIPLPAPVSLIGGSRKSRK